MIAAEVEATPPSERARFVICSPFAVLDVVDDLPHNATGEFAVEVSGRPVVRVYVEDSRVCWIAARGLSRRLSDLLLARIRPPITREQIEGMFQRGVRDRRPLGELLVETGLLTADDLRSALLDHTVESLVAVSGECGVARWIPRKQRRFDASFTFVTGDLAVATGARLAHGLHPTSAELSAVEGVEHALTFARGEAWAHPIPIARVGASPTSRAVLALGRWASNALDVARGSSGRAFLVYGSTAASARGGVVVASEGPLIHVVSASDPRAFARVVSAATRAASLV